MDRAEMYYKMLRNLVVRRIGVGGGVMPYGRLIRIERGSLLRLRGEPDPPSQALPRWVRLKQAAEHYQVSPRLIRRLIANGQLDARRSTKTSPHRPRNTVAAGQIQVLDNVIRRRYITIAEAADYLQISDRTVRRLIADGELKGYRMGRSHRVIRVDLNEIDDQLMRPINEPLRPRKQRP
ncbi:helix-turn-helix domain-containing protein [Mycobacterium fragae]|uniref:helix-turn-helix domain-containing protein n=1 Tax=Mycobacterium fragae TaxID=1260918 RepID=UPI0027E2075A|nr:helix-turn-helix domain-containing protein [Mycobacterium fragae]